jgi:hypothetical protein
MAESQARLDEAAQLAERTRTDAEAARADADRQVTHLLDEARAEAAKIVGDAKATAERVRSDSDRELAAATQRRDSINAQLGNVRQMLATLTGTSMLPLTGLEDDDPAGATASAETGPAETGDRAEPAAGDDEPHDEHPSEEGDDDQSTSTDDAVVGSHG